jgi:hypothetical protein
MLSGLLALMLAAAPATAPAAAPQKAADPLEWKVPGMVSTLEVPGQMHVGGVPVRFRVHTSTEKVEQLLQHFATAFDEAGFYIQRNQRRLAAEPHLTALDTRTLTSYSVILNPEAGGLTTVVVGEARLKELKPSAPPSAFPLYPGAADVVHADFEGAKTLGYQVAAKEAEVRAWYQQRMTSAGFTEEAPLLFRRKEQQLHVSLSPQGGKLSVFLFLQTTPEPIPLDPSPQ